MLGGLYPGLYAITTGVEVPPEELTGQVTSDDMIVRQRVVAFAIDCKSLVTSSFAEVTAGTSEPTPTPQAIIPVKPGVKVLVTSSLVEGWKKP